MTASGHAIILQTDVYALTKKGEAELLGSRTVLESAALELLVRIDGRASVMDLAAGMSAVAPDRVAEALGQLLRAGLIDYVSETNEGLIEFDSVPGIATPSKSAMSQARRQAGAGVTSLEQQGYFVRIARTPADCPPLPADRRPLAIIIEDEPHLAEFLKHFIGFEGFEARTASNREEIVQALRRPPRPDLVLLDVMLPDADGFDILAKIRQHPALRAVPVIMLTAKTTREAVIKGIAGGADGYITKPFQTDVLVKAIQTMFGKAHGTKSDVWNTHET